MKILALDLGSRKSVVCEFKAETVEGRYGTVASSPDEISRLFKRTRAERVVMEIGPQAGWVHDLAVAEGIQTQVANTNGQAWRWRNVKSKTDRKDALKLAQLSAMGQLSLVHVPSVAVRQWRSLMEYRDKLMSGRNRSQNRIRSLLAGQGLSGALASGKAGWRERSRSYLASLARPLAGVGMEDLWRGQLGLELEALEQVEGRMEQVDARLDEIGASDSQVQLLRTIPGVGPRLAEALAASIDDPHRFRNRRQLGSYAGLVPRQFQSGQMDRQGRITKHGRALLRKLLVEVSWLGLRYNPWMREIYHRVQAGRRTRKKVAIVAVARRLLVVAWAMLRDRRPWRWPAGPGESRTEPPPRPSSRKRMKEFFSRRPHSAATVS